jgi:hypothetical protein
MNDAILLDILLCFIYTLISFGDRADKPNKLHVQRYSVEMFLTDTVMLCVNSALVYMIYSLNHAGFCYAYACRVQCSPDLTERR